MSALVLYILFGMGMLSALLMNDTLAIIGTPVVLALARNNDLEPKMLLPTIINLLLAYLLLRVFYRRHFHHQALDHSPALIKDAGLANLCKISLITLVILVAAKIIVSLLGVSLDFKLTYISQLISNVPLVALYLQVLDQLAVSAKELVALAAGSTIAGNLTILGAASNVIIIQNAEKCGETITFLEFVRIGVPLTALNLLVYWLFLTFCW